MPYSAEISRKNPAFFLFLIDQSGSMDDSFGGDPAAKKKKDGVVGAINKLLEEIIGRCSPPEVKDRFEISVLGYGGGKVSSAFSGNLSNKEIAKISEVYKNSIVKEEGEKKYPVWLNPIAAGDTPMCQALTKACTLLEKWVQEHPKSYPPALFNITDGEATDGEPTPLVEQIKGLKTDDGNVLVYNCHISSMQAPTVLYPESETELPGDKFAHLLFENSSILPDAIRERAKSELGLDMKPNSKGFVFNANMTDLIRLLDVGTRGER